MRVAMCRLPAFLLFTSISGMYLTTDAFHYTKESVPLQRRTNGYHCTICDSGDCLISDDPRCDYRREMDHVLEEVIQSKMDINPEMRAEVDLKLFELAEQGGGDGDCIPHVSQYTSCNKDNVCLGCVTCNCDAASRWDCDEVQRCRNDIALDIDHRILVQVMENLNDSKHDTSFKIKRSVSSTIQLKKNDREEALTSLEISSIINGFNGTKHTVKAMVNDNVVENDLDGATESMESMNASATEKIESVNDSDLEFDDLFPTYNAINGTHTKLLLPMLKNHTEDILDPDYMDSPDDNMTQNDDKRVEKILENQAKFLKEAILNKSNGEKRKMIFYANFNKDVSDLSNVDKNIKGFLVPGVGDGNDIYERQSVRVVKRQTDNISKNARTKILLNNSRRSAQDLKDNVFDPLNSIINTKRNEIKELEKIRDNLKEYLKLYLRNETILNIHQYMQENITKSYFTIYKMELEPKIQNDLIKNKEATSSDYLSKLQNDIYEVIKDIVEIQRNSMNKELPEDLNVLVESMRYYVHRQGRLHIEKEIKKIAGNKINNFRKFSKADRNNVAKQSTISTLVGILTVIDKDMPHSNALAPLSVAGKKIMKRIINNNYHESFSDHKFFTSQYNVTEKLKGIGNKWYSMTRRIASSRLPDRIPAMKLLHLELSRDIHKVKAVSTFIDFVQSRRFVTTEWGAIDHYATRIGEDLKIISKKIQEVIKIQNDMILRTTQRTTEVPLKLIPRKNSFLHQIKKLLKQSKNDMRNMFKNNKHLGIQYVSSANPLKHKENTKWQNILYGNLNRKKRSAIEFNKAVRRIKSIIPNYLRDKFGKARKPKAPKTKL